MPQEVKQMLGMLDLDSPPETVDKGWHVMARNGRFQGRQGNEQWQSIEGTTEIPNPFLIDDGQNVSIGRHYDAVYQRIFDFNYHPSGSAIFIYNTVSGVWQRLVQDGLNTEGSVLAFDPNFGIHSIDIIYGDPADGSLLTYVDSQGRPTKLNIERFLNQIAGTYATTKRSFINVIKAPFLFPPEVTYENDTTVNNNNCLNSLFQFAASPIYDDNERGCISTASRVALPVNPFSNTQNVDKSKDARIAVYVYTGDVNVKKIRLYVKQTQNGSQSDWLIVEDIPKYNNGVQVIADNTVYKFLFFNDGNYVAEDIAFATLQQSYVPDEANTQALPNGNVLAYGGITEGQDWFKSVFSFNLGGDSNSVTACPVQGFLFFAAYNGILTAGQPQIQLIVTGAGTNDGTGHPTDVTYAAQDYHFYADSNGSDVGFQVINNVSTNINTILTALKNAATAVGWVFVSQSSNAIVIYYPVGTVSFHATRVFGATPFVTNFFKLALYPGSNYSWALRYKDPNGKSIGAITDVTANVATLPYVTIFGITYTDVFLNLNGIIPPPWAVSYDVLRTNTLTYDKYLTWICNQALSNADSLAVNKYAYIGITNIDDYNEQIQATQPVVSYGFSSGDRIHFWRVYRLDGTSVPIDFDYQVLGLEINPLINGTPHIGRFIKIAYPSADIGINFKFDGDPNYQDYLFTVYNIASNSTPQTENTGVSSTEGNVYYESGYSFGIGNPGTITAYHFGNFGNNQVEIQEGDVYYRDRTIPGGNTYYIDVIGNDKFSNRYATPLITLPAPIITPAYTLDSENKLAASESFGSYPRFSDGGGVLLNTSGNTLQVRLRGTQQVAADHPTYMDIKVKICNSDNTTGTIVELLHKSDPISTLANTLLDITFDGTFGVPAGAKMWLLFGNGLQVIDLHTQPFQMRIDVLHPITVQVFDKSFSDVFNLVCNSDNRPTIADPQAKRTYFPTLYRWGQEYIPDTNINNTNIFYFNDADEATRAFGDIERLMILNKQLYFMQKNKIGATGIFQKYIRNNEGQSQLVVGSSIIEKNNIQYFVYEGGIGNQPASACISNYAIYFVDPIKSVICRLSLDGVTTISVLYKAQTWAGENLVKYLNDIPYQFGGSAKVLGTFRVYKDKPGEYWLMAQGGTSGLGTLPGEVLTFDESKNGFSSFMSMNADQIINAENNLYSFYNGKLYIHNDNIHNARFYGVDYDCKITFVFNDKVVIKKKFLTVGYNSNRVWSSSDIANYSAGVENIDAIITSFINPQTGFRQTSQLKDVDYEVTEGLTVAAFLRDANSGQNPTVAVLENDYLSGFWIQVEFSYGGGKSAFFYAPYINWIPSQRVL